MIESAAAGPSRSGRGRGDEGVDTMDRPMSSRVPAFALLALAAALAAAALLGPLALGIIDCGSAPTA